MAERPRSITLIGWLFIAIGIVTILKDVAPLVTSHAADQWSSLKAAWLSDLVPAWTIRAIAIVCGALVLRGVSWARWVLVAWMAFHVVISSSSLVQMTIHGAISLVVVYVLFRRPAAAFFRRAAAAPR